MKRYLCDPSKNVDCLKTECQRLCISTLQLECAATGKQAELFDLLCELGDAIPDYGESMSYYDEVFDSIMKLFNESGTWIREGDNFRCSRCERLDDAQSPYCRWCGAFMEVQSDDRETSDSNVVRAGGEASTGE